MQSSRSGGAAFKSVNGDWQRALKGALKQTGIPDGHPTASETRSRLDPSSAGVPIERVSVLLGHTSIKVTEKYYAPWVRARPEQLESDVRRTRERLARVLTGHFFQVS
jgi:integrase/recombinase XerD